MYKGSEVERGPGLFKEERGKRVEGRGEHGGGLGQLGSVGQSCDASLTPAGTQLC